MSKTMTKSALIDAVATQLGDGFSKKQVTTFFEILADIAHKELKGSGEFTLPGFAKFIVTKRPATPERPGVNPFTKEPITIPAKPASKKVRATALKALKDLVQ